MTKLALICALPNNLRMRSPSIGCRGHKKHRLHKFGRRQNSSSNQRSSAIIASENRTHRVSPMAFMVPGYSPHVIAAISRLVRRGRRVRVQTNSHNCRSNKRAENSSCRFVNPDIISGESSVRTACRRRYRTVCSQRTEVQRPERATKLRATAQTYASIRESSSSNTETGSE